MKFSVKLLLGTCFLLFSCDQGKKSEEAGELINGALIEGSSEDPSDPVLWSKILKSSPSTVLGFLEAWWEKDHSSRPEPDGKGEFETSSEYAARIAAFNTSRERYPSRCFAFVQSGNFGYDADTAKAKFVGRSIPPTVWDDADRINQFENVTIVQPLGLVDTFMEGLVPRDVAQRLREKADDTVWIVRIFSLAGLQKPAFFGWSAAEDAFSRLTPILAFDDEEFRKVTNQIYSVKFRTTGELIKVVIFDGTEEGLNRPLFTWNGPKKRCAVN
jgi:hypothetical protein